MGVILQTFSKVVFYDTASKALTIYHKVEKIRVSIQMEIVFEMKWRTKVMRRNRGTTDNALSSASTPKNTREKTHAASRIASPHRALSFFF